MSRVNKLGSKKRIRTILFSARANSIFVRMDPLLKFVVWLVMSVAVVRMITEPFPDAALGAVVLIFAVSFLAESGTIKFLVKSYLALILVALAVLFLWWIFFNQVGNNVILYISFIGLSLKVTTESAYIGVAKVMGYAAMALLTLLVLMTTRDSDAIKALNELKMPFRVVFFLSLTLRSFNIMAEDLETINQAKFARGGSHSMNPISRAKDFMALSVPLTVAMIKRSVEMGSALEARGFSNAKKVTQFGEINRSAYDFALLALSIIVLVAAYTINLTMIIGV